MKEKLARFFWGRYGGDTLGWAIIILSMILSFLSNALDSYLMMIPSYALLVWEVFRMLSRNTVKRAAENRKFLGFWNPIRKWFKLQYHRIRDIRTHRYFSCPKCRNNLRVPKGKGEITVTCPVCKTKFDRRT